MRASEISAVANSINEMHLVNLSTLLFNSILFVMIDIRLPHPSNKMKMNTTRNGIRNLDFIGLNFFLLGVFLSKTFHI